MKINVIQDFELCELLRDAALSDNPTQQYLMMNENW